MGEIIAGSRVMVRIEAEAEDHDWPDDCASFADVFGDIDGPDDGFEAGTVIRVDEDGSVPIALVVWDGLADASEDADGDGMPAVWAWRVPCFALMPHGSCRSRWERLVDPVRQIATIIGCPANADPLTDLDGLVSMVRGLAERAETVRVVTADRDALQFQIDGVITVLESAGNHDDTAPLASRVISVATPPGFDAMLEKSIAEHDRLTAERDRRIDPVEHARAVMDGFTRALDAQAPDHDKAATLCFCAWCRWDVSDERATLLARVGADVLAEVER